MNKKISGMYSEFLVFGMIFIIMYQYFIGKYIFFDYHAECFYDNVFIMIYILLIWYGVYNKCAYQDKFEAFNKYSIGIYIIHPLLIRAIGKYYNYCNSILNIIVYLIILVICIVICIVINKIPKLKEIIRI